MKVFCLRKQSALYNDYWWHSVLRWRTAFIIHIHRCIQSYMDALGFIYLCVCWCTHTGNIYLHFNPRLGQVYWKEHWLEIKEILYLILALEIISWTKGNLLISLGLNIPIKINYSELQHFLFFVYICVLDDLNHLPGFKYHNCTDCFQIYNSNTRLFSPEIQYYICNLLLIVASNWTSIRISGF